MFEGLLDHEDKNRRELPQKQLPPMCRDYNRKEGCLHVSCEELHLCIYFLQNRCTTKKCSKTHDLEAPRNIRLLERQGWCSPDDRQMAMGIVRQRASGQVASVCMAYNMGCCTASGCARLHVCYRHVLDNCPLDDCALSHEVSNSEHNAALLAGTGLVDTPVSELLHRLRDQLRRRPPQPSVCRAADSRPGGCRRHCLRPHYCEAFALGRCRYGDRCSKSHTLQDPHNQRVLRFFDWTEGRVLDALTAGDGGSAPLPATSEPRANACDANTAVDGNSSADLPAGPSRSQHGETEADAGEATSVKRSEGGQSHENRPGCSPEISVEHTLRYLLETEQRCQQSQQRWKDAEKQLEMERKSWLEKERKWEQKEKEWQEKERKEMEKQARQQEERENEDRARKEREDQARFQREREQQERKRQENKHRQEMAEKEAYEWELLENYTRLMDGHSSSEKTMTAIKQKNAELEQDIATMQLLLQESGLLGSQNTMTNTKLEPEHQKNKEELAKLREQVRKHKECLECSVCLGIFTEPVTLSCAHTFCKACIEASRRQNVVTFAGHRQPCGTYQCPLCRATTQQGTCLALANLAKLVSDVQN